MATVVLVRHATTAATGTRLGGWTPGVHLDEAGRQQAERTAQHLSELDIAAVYSSPLERTRETAEIVAAAHGISVEIDEGLGEVDYGTWTNKTLKSLRNRKLWPVIQHTPSRVAFPEGEAIRGAQARAVDAVERLAVTAKNTTIVCVSHADVIKAVVAHYVGMPLDMFQRLVISPASATVLHLGDGQPARLVRFNDTATRPGGAQ